jgi:hypothetical protein
MRTETASGALGRIRAGTTGWVAIGDFVDAWRRADPAERRAIVVTPPDDEDVAAEPRWAALIAASVDWLSATSDEPLPPPAWAMSRRFVLDEPWFLIPGLALRMHQLVDTPAAFKVRNIFGGDRILFRV